ncbi:hypothetical protein K1T71_007627 [Dendrolimus kikuchii]|uniref:Uncharacterized protein n=1 Tax=Dendrolimus kikuchii TaxID=765133 RepID=A0ACC1CXR6_9NEOP|nr:hypothetical protein K1T71_007627 [Dendrolimus kikuchii]
MSAEESDDEPLSVLAATKKLNPELFNIPSLEVTLVPKKKKKKKIIQRKEPSVTIKFKQPRIPAAPPIIERPTDVWLYLKDLNPTGPYSCLLCHDWFISRPKIVIHYILNHRKGFCGICRYFVPDRESWSEHLTFHSPWPCSQCIKNFDTESELRDHLSTVHNLVHCKLCHFRVSDNDQYNTHLLGKHNVTNVSSKNQPYPWELEDDGTTDFLCLLCNKSHNANSSFFTHYMGHHHFTIKCLAKIISGINLPFIVLGANLSAQFIHGQLSKHSRFGYIEPDDKSNDSSVKNDLTPTALFNDMLPQIKQESLSDQEEPKLETEIKFEPISDIMDHTAEEDFDITQMELIIPEKCYYDYVNYLLKHVNLNQMPVNSDINYGPSRDNVFIEILCCLCKTKHSTVQNLLIHMSKMHSIKSTLFYSCRVCAASFESQSDLDTHVTEELGEFDDLWLCQFCDKEFDNRERVRNHLSEHWNEMEYDNCFSPHLGFKCEHCPMLFWNETDRQVHQVRVHFDKYKEQYYWCDSCNETFSDKVWFSHHYIDKHVKEEYKPMYLLKCLMCCLIRPNLEDMRSHFKENHPDAKKVYCHLDGCKFRPLSHQKSFKVHLKSIHDPSSLKQRMARCAVCKREFANSRACGAHMAQKHGPGRFKCKLCSDTLATMDERKLHYLIAHPGQHPYQCEDCGKAFQYKSTLYMHKKDHVPVKESYPCSYCGKVFAKRDSFREHVAIHEGPRHACSYCPMRFVQRSNMLRHERRHTGERPYSCQYCPRTFADKGACTSHTRTHIRDKSFSCMYCGQTFVQKSKLTYHIRKHTGENLETCTVCSKIFTSACSLREHMKIHVAKKDIVKCPLCDKKYQDERCMLRHLRTSHAHPSYKCPVCAKMMTSAAGLRDHVFTHSRIKSYRCKVCPKGYNSKRTIIKHLRRRHGFKNDVVKSYFRRLDPRECQFGLDEDVMTKIFGKPKKIYEKTTVPVEFEPPLVEDNVRKSQKVKVKINAKNVKESKSKEIEQESDKDSGSGNRSIKQEKEDNYDEELEPTDFVSVKIEPMDYEES